MSQIPQHHLYIPLFDSLTTEHAVIYTSEHLNVNTTTCFSIQAIWTASTGRTGLFEIQCSNVDINSDTYWTTMSAIYVTESANSFHVNVEDSAIGFIRIRYTSTAGTGGYITANINSKQR